MRRSLSLTHTHMTDARARDSIYFHLLEHQHRTEHTTGRRADAREPSFGQYYRDVATECNRGEMLHTRCSVCPNITEWKRNSNMRALISRSKNMRCPLRLRPKFDSRHASRCIPTMPNQSKRCHHLTARLQNASIANQSA